MNGPTRGLSSPRLPHKGLGYTIGCGGPGATGGRGEAILKDNPDAQPLHSQEGGPGLGAQCLGFRPSLDFNLLSEEGDLPISVGLGFPHSVIPGVLPCPAVPLLLYAHSVTRHSPTLPSTEVPSPLQPLCGPETQPDLPFTQAQAPSPQGPSVALRLGGAAGQEGPGRS